MESRRNYRDDWQNDYKRSRMTYNGDQDYTRSSRGDELRSRDYYPSSRSEYNQDYNRDNQLHGMWGDVKDSVKGFFGKGPKGYKRSDERIQEDVNEALTRHYDVDASDIEVSVLDGEVTLAGTVANRQMKRRAEEAVEFCSGVKDVHNQLGFASEI